MSYEKQTWNKYDDLKTEEENIENGAVVTDNRMNHIEEGIYSHTIDISNPHKVTAAQVGLGNIQNFGLATEDEAKQAISNAKYMTPSLTQAVLSANINSIAYANSADGTNGFTTDYPNLNLLSQNDLIPGYLNDKGALNPPTEGVNERTSPFLEVDASQSYTAQVFVTLSVTSRTSWSAIGWFDSNQQFINRVVFQENNPQSADYYNYSHTVQPPSNAKFVRISFRQWGDGKLKLEQGSTATPWMPSASEVTTADYPKYVGFSNTVKTNKSASDYTWFPVKDSELTNKVDSHVNNKANPHAVTASQVGAYSKQEIDTNLSKAVMADDSGKVKLTDFEVTTISETVNIGNGLSLNFQRKGEFVLVRFSGSLTAINSGTYFSTAVPEQWRPDGIKELIGHFASGALAFHVDLETDGRVKWWGASGATGAARGTAMYFLK